MTRCNTGTHSSLRASASFCSIGCVLAMKFGGEARIHEMSKTQKSFLEIPPISDLIRLLTILLMFLKSKLRNTS